MKVYFCCPQKKMWWQLALFSTWSAAATLLLRPPPSLPLRVAVAVAGTAIMARSPAPPLWHVAALALHLLPLAVWEEGSVCTDAVLVSAYLVAVDWRRAYAQAAKAAR